MSQPAEEVCDGAERAERAAASCLARAGVWLLGAAVWIGGCAPRTSSEVAAPVEATAPSAENLLKELDEVLLFTYEQRNLSLSEHAAWQILHGVLAYQRDFLVERDGQLVSAVDHVLAGGPMKGFTLQVATDQPAGEPGIRALLEPGSKSGQGHADQWLAILAQADLPAEEPIRVEDQTLTMAHFVSQVQWDVPRNAEREYSWTLIGLTHYLPTDAEWTASDGKIWSIERLVQSEAQQELGPSACGGTHRLIGMTMALRRHLEGGGELSGSWRLADQVIEQAILDARQYQNPDGSFSTRYFDSPGSSPDLAQNLGTTGHILEFLTLALDDQQLREPWVRGAVMNLCELFRTTRGVPLECGALYHAAHALVLYRTRLFGPRRYGGPPASQTAGPATGDRNPAAPDRPTVLDTGA